MNQAGANSGRHEGIQTRALTHGEAKINGHEAEDTVRKHGKQRINHGICAQPSTGGANRQNGFDHTGAANGRNDGLEDCGYRTHQGIEPVFLFSGSRSSFPETAEFCHFIFPISHIRDNHDLCLIAFFPNPLHTIQCLQGFYIRLGGILEYQSQSCHAVGHRLNIR